MTIHELKIPYEPLECERCQSDTFHLTIDFVAVCTGCDSQINGINPALLKDYKELGLSALHGNEACVHEPTFVIMHPDGKTHTCIKCGVYYE